MCEQQTVSESSKRIVFVCVDGSDDSKRAFDFYLDHICRSKDHVVVFHVQETPHVAPILSGWAAQYDQWEAAMKKLHTEAKALLRYYGDILKTKPDVTFKLLKEGGHTGQTICTNIKEENASLVVIGCRGQGKISRTILGSVSDYVLHHAQAPIFIVPPQAAKKRPLTE